MIVGVFYASNLGFGRDNQRGEQRFKDILEPISLFTQNQLKWANDLQCIIHQSAKGKDIFDASSKDS